MRRIFKEPSALARRAGDSFATTTLAHGNARIKLAASTGLGRGREPDRSRVFEVTSRTLQHRKGAAPRARAVTSVARTGQKRLFRPIERLLSPRREHASCSSWSRFVSLFLYSVNRSVVSVLVILSVVFLRRFGLLRRRIVVLGRLRFRLLAWWRLESAVRIVFVGVRTRISARASVHVSICTAISIPT